MDMESLTSSQWPLLWSCSGQELTGDRSNEEECKSNLGPQRDPNESFDTNDIESKIG